MNRSKIDQQLCSYTANYYKHNYLDTFNNSCANNERDSLKIYVNAT